MTRPRNIIRAALVVAVIVLAALPGPARTTQAPDCTSETVTTCIGAQGALADSAAASGKTASDAVHRSGHSGVGLRGIVLLVVAALGSVWLFGARVRRWMVGI